MDLKNNPNVKLVVTGLLSAVVAAFAVYLVTTFSAGVDAASEKEIEEVIKRMNVTPSGKSFGMVLDEHGDKLDALILKLGFVEQSVNRLSSD